VLGEESIPTARLALRVVLALQVYYNELAAASVAPTTKLYFFNLALCAAMNTIGPLPAQQALTLLCHTYLKGMFHHFFVGDRMRYRGLFEEHVGTLFGKPQVVNGTRRTAGAITKASRKGQKFGAGGLGSDSVICAQTADLLNRPVGYTDGERRYDLPAPWCGRYRPAHVARVHV
jgi:hypothetical protein